MWVTTVILDIGFECKIIGRSALVLDCQLHLRPDSEIASVGDDPRNILQISSCLNQRIWFERSVYGTIIVAAEHFSVKVLIDTRFELFHVNPISCIDQQTKFTDGTKQLLESAPKESVLQ